MTQFALALITLLGSLLVVGCTSNSPTNPLNAAQNTVNAKPTQTAAADPMAVGRDLYKQNCAQCHKDTGVGGPVEIEGKKLNPDNLTSDKIKKFSDDKILGYVRDGIEDEGMPSFKGRLSEAEMREVVRYVRVALQKLPEGGVNTNSVANANAR